MNLTILFYLIPRGDVVEYDAGIGRSNKGVNRLESESGSGKCIVSRFVIQAWGRSYVESNEMPKGSMWSSVPLPQLLLNVCSYVVIGAAAPKGAMSC